MNKKKIRLDTLLVEKGLFSSREKAKAEIMCGNVFVNNQLVDKPGTQIEIDSNILIKKKTLSYVSRGGLKLERALEVFDIPLKDRIALDAGASTGGFTDCLLQNGVKKVYAVDVGYGQLDYRLRQDKRVIVLERTNVRYLKLEDIGEEMDIITADLSFISLSKVFYTFSQLLKKHGDLITLIKPQFEVGRKEVGKKGVVREKKLHVKAISDTIVSAKECNLFLNNLTHSPIKGPKGNIEYIAHFKNSLLNDYVINVEYVVEQSHLELL